MKAGSAGNMMQQPSPEQVENQKIDAKLNELQQKKALKDNPDLQSPTDALRAMLMPPKPKVKPEAKMKVLFNNGEMLGEGRVAKNQNGGHLGKNEAIPYNSAVTSNPHLRSGGTQAVANYQAMMNAKYGTNLVVDGMWGPQTKAAYEKFVLAEQNAQAMHAEAAKLTNGTLPSATSFNNTFGVKAPVLLPKQKQYNSNGAPSVGVTAQPGWGVR